MSCDGSKHDPLHCMDGSVASLGAGGVLLNDIRMALEYEH